MRMLVVYICALAFVGEALRRQSRRSKLSTDCPDRTKELAVNLQVADFANRRAAIAKFRAKLQELEDSEKFSWFRIKSDAGRDTTTFAGYLDLPDGDLLSKYQMQFRYRRNLAGHKVNKSDFVIKYKEPAPFSLKPMTASAEWEDAWSCKVEDNLKYVQCPQKTCFPDGDCYTPCLDRGSPGIGLEAVEEAPKIKGNPGDRFAEEFTAVEQFQTLADVTQFFPDIASHFGLGDASTPLTVSNRQYRWIHDNIKMKFNGQKVECGFVLWYTSLEDLNAGTVAPEKGEWSFSFDADAEKEALGAQFLEWVANSIPSVVGFPAKSQSQQGRRRRNRRRNRRRRRQ